MTVFKCKMCGADLTLVEGSNICECEYCGTQQTVPTADNDKKMNLFNRANRLRFANEFDKASGVFESIVSEFPEEAEAYWGLCLCKYGIEYVDDPATAKKIPTCHRTSYDSIFNDSNFEMAQEYADVVARKLYREEAKEIDRIQKSILAIAQNEEPFDIFICYKETAEDGQRTVDSVLAQDMYDALTEKGYKVFFARITLEDKLGQEYEPYIFSALSSARVMLAVGTSYEYYNAVWVKNEWGRFLDMMKSDKKKLLIPCYRDIDAYDIPGEFKHLQAQNMGKVGFMQDLIRGIGKIMPLANQNSNAQQVQNTVVVQQSAQGGTADSLLKRAFMFLEDGDWNSANKYAEKVLDLDPENARAYVVKLLAERKLRTQEELHFSKSKNANELFTKPIWNSANYKKAVRFADMLLKTELDKYGFDNAEEYNRRRYEAAKAEMDSAKTDNEFHKAAKSFEFLYYKDSAQLAEQCRERAKEYLYQKALSDMNSAQTDKEYNTAAIKFAYLSDYRNSIELAKKCYEKANEARYKQLLSGQKQAAMGKIGDLVLFGKYEWYIIDKTDEHCTLLCKKNLRAKSYHDECVPITWENCYLRKWLNEEFINEFTAEEKALIAYTTIVNSDNAKYKTKGGNNTVDRIFLLSLDEAKKYFSDDKSCDLGSTCWLRSPGIRQNFAAYVDSAGSLHDSGNVVYDGYGVYPMVRPALNLKFESFNPEIRDDSELREKLRVQVELERQKKEQQEKEWQEKEQQEKERPFAMGKIGDLVLFGKYEWYIIDKTAEHCTLLCKKNVGIRCYHEKDEAITWEKCTLRRWLNQEFFNEFEAEEKALIADTNIINSDNAEFGTKGGNDTVDKIFLLSFDEITDYFEYHGYDYGWGLRSPDNNQKYAADADSNSLNEVGVFVRFANSKGGWWLRSPGREQKCAAFTSISKFSMRSNDIESWRYGAKVNSLLWVYPALNIKFESFSPKFREILRIQDQIRTLHSDITRIDNNLSILNTQLQQQQSIYAENEKKLFGKKKVKEAQAKISFYTAELEKAEKQKNDKEKELSELEVKFKALQSET